MRVPTIVRRDRSYTFERSVAPLAVPSEASALIILPYLENITLFPIQSLGRSCQDSDEFFIMSSTTTTVVFISSNNLLQPSPKAGIRARVLAAYQPPSIFRCSCVYTKCCFFFFVVVNTSLLFRELILEQSITFLPPNNSPTLASAVFVCDLENI